MLLFRNIIKVPRKDNPHEYIVRQSEYILYLLLMGAGIAFILLLLFIYRSADIVVERQEMSIMGQFLGGLLGTLIMLVHLIIRGFIISKLITYFYSCTIIESTRIIQFKYHLVFKEVVNVAELYRILSISSSQKGFFESVFDFGDITLQLQNDYSIRIKNIPRPKKVVQKLEELKEHAIEQRLTSEDIEQPNDASLEMGVAPQSKKSEELPNELKEEIKQEVKQELSAEIAEEIGKDIFIVEPTR